MVDFSLEYKESVLAVLEKAESELKNCLDVIDRGGAIRLKEELNEAKPKEGESTIKIDGKWLYIVSKIINFLDKDEDRDETIDFNALKQYIIKLREEEKQKRE